MSRIEEISKDFRDCTLAMNSGRYTCAKEYLPSSPDTISDGDMKGRDPKDGSSSSTVGTILDIQKKNELLKINKYHQGSEYDSANA